VIATVLDNTVARFILPSFHYKFNSVKTPSSETKSFVATKEVLRTLRSKKFDC
jgi:hypothetical protein